MKSSKVCITTRSPLASLLLKGLATKHVTVKMDYLDNTIFLLMMVPCSNMVSIWITLCDSYLHQLCNSHIQSRKCNRWTELVAHTELRWHLSAVDQNLLLFNPNYFICSLQNGIEIISSYSSQCFFVTYGQIKQNIMC